MRTRHTFRPRLSEQLEDRVVPSLAGLPATPTVPRMVASPVAGSTQGVAPTLILGLPVPLPQSVQADEAGRAAIAAFEQAYTQAIDDILLAPDASGTVNPWANREAFDAAVRAALDALAESLSAPLVGGDPGSDAAAQAANALVGPGPSSLESLLLALPTSTIIQTSSGVATAQVTVSIPRLTSGLATDSIDSPVQSEAGRQGIAVNQGAIDGIDLDLDLDDSSRAIFEARGAFTGFLTAYFRAAGEVLAISDPGETRDAATRRDEFDGRVYAALLTLEASIVGVLESQAAASGPVESARDAIAGDGPDSLRSQLSAVAAPDGTEASLVQEFTLASIRAIARTLALVSSDLAAAFSPPTFRG